LLTALFEFLENLFYSCSIFTNIYIIIVILDVKLQCMSTTAFLNNIIDLLRKKYNTFAEEKNQATIVAG